MKHYPIIVDDVEYASTADLVKKLNLNVKSNVLYTHYTKNKKQFTFDELTEAVEYLTEHTKPSTCREHDDGVNLGDLLYGAISTEDNFVHIEDFLAGIPIKGMPESCFVDYFTSYYNKTKPYLPDTLTLDYLLEILDYYFKGQAHPDLIDSIANGKKRFVAGKPLNQYAKEYDLNYNLVYTTYWDTRNLNNPDERFIQALEEKQKQLVQRRNNSKK